MPLLVIGINDNAGGGKNIFNNLSVGRFTIKQFTKGHLA